MAQGVVLALDIGGTHTRLGLVDQKGELTRYLSLPSAMWNSGDALTNLGKLIQDYMKSACDTQPLAISLGFPAAVDKSRRGIVNAPTIPAFDNVKVADLLQEMLHIPVYLDRDVVMLYAHAARTLGMPEEGTTLCFFIGTGIGNLIVLDGKIHQGAHGIAGELGHIPLADKTAPCGCGQLGCAEQYAAGHALVALRDHHLPGEDLDTLFTHHMALPPVQAFIDTLAQVMATEMIILDPDRVLIGGGVAHMPGFPLEILRNKVTARLRDPKAPTQWFTAPDAQRAGVIGAGLRAFIKMDKETA